MSFESKKKLDSICNDFEDNWNPKSRVDLSDYLDKVGPELRDGLLRQLLAVDIELRQKSTHELSIKDYEHLGQPALDYAKELIGDVADAHKTVRAFEADAPPVQGWDKGAKGEDENGMVPDKQIGPYKLLHKIGEGGMGSVWLAEQKQPVQRQVAIKVIQDAKLDNAEVRARFDAERQAIALMDHPNIAKVFDAGTTENGIAYFVMELVNGVPIVEYCDNKKLSIHDRLEIFVAVCRAVQHAHQKGIIHRDLKPSNVLVAEHDGISVPKVIDFGLAKTLDHTTRLTDQSVHTQIGQVIGTVQYMAPEQAMSDASNVDTRTDVYSLGVMLYELLTGSTPLDRQTIADHAIIKILELIRDSEPPRPSDRLSSIDLESVSGIGQLRKIAPLRLQQELRGELDWIVMKALEKDQKRRYESPLDFSSDIRNYLNGDVVVAKPPSTGYLISKFVRRHQVAVAAAGLVALILVIGIAGTSYGMFRAWDSERLAQGALKNEKTQRRYAEAVANFVEHDFLALTSVEGQMEAIDDDAEISRELTKDTTLGQLLDRAAKKLQQRDDLEPIIEARLLSIIGNSMRANGDGKRSLPFLKKTLEIRQSIMPDHAVTTSSIGDLANGYFVSGQYEKALPLSKQALKRHTEFLGEDHPNTVNATLSLAEVYKSLGKLKLAFPLFEKSLAKRMAKYGEQHADTVKATNKLALAYLDAGKPDEAMPMLKKSLAKNKLLLGSDHPDTLSNMDHLAVAYRNLGQNETAINLWRQTLETTQEKMGGDHPSTLNSMHNLAIGYAAIGQLDKAATLFEQVLKIKKAKHGEDHPETLATMNDLAGAYRSLGQLDKALPISEKTLELRKERLGAEHPDTIISMNNLATCYYSVGRYDSAIPVLEESVKVMKATLGEDHPDTLLVMGNLANIYRSTGKVTLAIPILEKALKITKASFEDDHPSTLISKNNLAIAYFTARNYERALPLFDQTLKQRQDKLGADHPDTLMSMNNLAMCYRDSGNLKKAIPLFEQSLDLTKNKLGNDHPLTLLGTSNLAGAYFLAGDAERSLPLYKSALEAQEKKLGRSHFNTLMTIASLGVVYSDTERLEEAIRLLKESNDHIPKYAQLSWVRPELRLAYARSGQRDEFIEMADQDQKTARQIHSEGSVELASVLVDLGRDWNLIGDHSQAILLLQESLEIMQKERPDHWSKFYTQSLLGSALMGQVVNVQQTDENEAQQETDDKKMESFEIVEPLLIQGYQGLRSNASSLPRRERNRWLNDSVERLVKFAGQIEDETKIQKWQTEKDALRQLIEELDAEK